MHLFILLFYFGFLGLLRLSDKKFLVEKTVTGKKWMAETETREERWERQHWAWGNGGISGMEGPVPALSVLELDCCSCCCVVLCTVKMVWLFFFFLGYFSHLSEHGRPKMMWFPHTQPQQSCWSNMMCGTHIFFICEYSSSAYFSLLPSVRMKILWVNFTQAIPYLILHHVSLHISWRPPFKIGTAASDGVFGSGHSQQ